MQSKIYTFRGFFIFFQSVKANIKNGTVRTLFVTVVVEHILALSPGNTKHGRADAKDDEEEIEDRIGRENIVRKAEQHE